MMMMMMIMTGFSHIRFARYMRFIFSCTFYSERSTVLLISVDSMPILLWNGWIFKEFFKEHIIISSQLRIKQWRKRSFPPDSVRNCAKSLVNTFGTIIVAINLSLQTVNIMNLFWKKRKKMRDASWDLFFLCFCCYLNGLIWSGWVPSLWKWMSCV